MSLSAPPSGEVDALRRELADRDRQIAELRREVGSRGPGENDAWRSGRSDDLAACELELEAARRQIDLLQQRLEALE
jgi:hypothetical protein